jgi:hypothetical protein
MDDIRSARSTSTNPHTAAGEIAEQFAGVEPRAIVFFVAHGLDGRALSAALRERFPAAPVIGCTTAGEFCNSGTGTGATTAIALGGRKIRRAAAALAQFDGGVDEAIAGATRAIAATLGVDLRAVDPRRWVGVVLVEGLRGHEEACNDALGNAAPLLSFVGGSAGDGLEFVRTRVFVDGEESDDGAALLVIEAEVPFLVSKTCSFVPAGRRFTVTRADVENRIVHELDGRPVAHVYAEAVGTTPDQLDGDVFMSSPLGLMIEGRPWIRSPQRLLPDNGGLRFYCRILEGTEVELMKSTDLVEDTRRAIARAKEELGGTIAGGLAFNCILRRLELDAKKQHEPFLQLFSGLQVAGFHTYGESWLGHINQTLTALWFA